jgi:hypothetical protein
MIALAGSIIIVALSVLIIRYTSAKYPSDKRDDVV